MVKSWMLAHCSPFTLSKDDCKPSTFPSSPSGAYRVEKGLWLERGLGARYGLDVDAAASATVSVLSSSERSL